ADLRVAVADRRLEAAARAVFGLLDGAEVAADAAAEALRFDVRRLRGRQLGADVAAHRLDLHVAVLADRRGDLDVPGYGAGLELLQLGADGARVPGYRVELDAAAGAADVDVAADRLQVRAIARIGARRAERDVAADAFDVDLRRPAVDRQLAADALD